MKCIATRNDSGLKERIRSFLTDKDSTAVTGMRRMGRDAMIDLVLKVATETGLDCGCIPNAAPDTEIVLVLDYPTDFGPILEKWPSSDILYYRELCHQVPAVARLRR